MLMYFQFKKGSEAEANHARLLQQQNEHSECEEHVKSQLTPNAKIVYKYRTGEPFGFRAPKDEVAAFRASHSEWARTQSGVIVPATSETKPSLFMYVRPVTYYDRLNAFVPGAPANVFIQDLDMQRILAPIYVGARCVAIDSALYCHEKAKPVKGLIEVMASACLS